MADQALIGADLLLQVADLVLDDVHLLLQIVLFVQGVALIGLDGLQLVLQVLLLLAQALRLLFQGVDLRLGHGPGLHHHGRTGQGQQTGQHQQQTQALSAPGQLLFQCVFHLCPPLPQENIRRDGQQQ